MVNAFKTGQSRGHPPPDSLLERDSRGDRGRVPPPLTQFGDLLQAAEVLPQILVPMITHESSPYIDLRHTFGNFADVLLRSADLASVSVVSLGQAYALPLVFAVLSQVISYRRYRYQVVEA